MDFRLALVVLASIAAVNAKLELPEDMKQGAYCKACKATVQALKTYVNENRKSHDYAEVCQRKYFKKDEQPIKEKLKTCDHLFELYEDEIAETIKNLDWTQFKTWFCHERTYACVGVYSDSKLHKGHEGITDEEIVRKLKETHKGEIRYPNPVRKDEL